MHCPGPGTCSIQHVVAELGRGCEGQGDPLGSDGSLPFSERPPKTKPFWKGLGDSPKERRRNVGSGGIKGRRELGEWREWRCPASPPSREASTWLKARSQPVLTAQGPLPGGRCRGSGEVTAGEGESVCEDEFGIYRCLGSGETGHRLTRADL